MKCALLSFMVIILMTSQVFSVRAQNKQIQPCTEDEIKSVTDEFKTMKESITSKMTLSSDRFTWAEYFLYFYDLRADWINEKVPAFPSCEEIESMSSTTIILIDELLITTGLANTGLLELERKHTDVALEFQKRINTIDSSRLDKALEDFNTAYAGLGEITVVEESVPTETIPVNDESVNLVFTDEFADPDFIGLFEVTCPHDVYPVIYPTGTNIRPTEAIEFLASIEVLEEETLEMGDAQNIYRNGELRYPKILVGNISMDDVNTLNEFQDKYKPHNFIFIPLEGSKYYRIERILPDYGQIWQKIDKDDVENLFEILGHPECLEDLEFYPD